MLILQAKQEEERQHAIKLREQEQKRKHSEFLRQTEKAYLDHQKQIEEKKVLMTQRDEQRQRAMIQHQRELHKSSLEKRAVTERKIKATRKNAELMVFEQKRIFDEKEQRAEQQRWKFEKHRLAYQKELHHKGEIKQKVIQEVIERDKKNERVKKRKYFEKEVKVEIRRKKLEKEILRELSEKKKKEEERDWYSFFFSEFVFLKNSLFDFFLINAREMN